MSTPNTASLIRPAFTLFVLLTIVTGLAYPLVVTGLGKALFPQAAAGSLIEQNGQTVASSLIGQSFSGPTYFWSRPSATAPQPDNGLASGGSNLGPTNPALKDAVKGRIDLIRGAHPDQTGPVPADLVTTSASGLDPHISPAAAAYQIHRIAKARGLSDEQVQLLVAANTDGPQWGLFGEPVVNVVKLNLALDGLKK
ncbi:potassium-transporting ATPase subunit KdpC [Silvimonas amylolytica]|uniref:Potassium-transporting ATPase KdpC subunit n=1 Tax=Silvimonas amylolytica TaxID=449663 RepID=A0ABQ2PKM0_9NEIS|nr:potassium-transporting ATPase subunit KdpC [Silvimonas amylolytica]GGP26164.1 potassium-transporting ATPase KdpC subunit [Silvimonas amylolytica]